MIEQTLFNEKEKIPDLEDKNIRNQYSIFLNNIIEDYVPKWKSFARRDYPELFFTTHKYDFSNALPGVEFVRLSQKISNFYLQVELQQALVPHNLKEYGYEKKDSRPPLYLKKIQNTKEFLNELTMLVKMFYEE